MILVDANVLLRLIQVGHPHQKPAVDATTLLHTRDGERLVICPQVLFEMYAVCTRPTDAAYPGFGLAPAAAMEELEKVEQRFRMETEPLTLVNRWKELVVKHGVAGKATHDARLAALMIEKAIPSILTFNDSHFVRFVEITPLNPFDVVGISRA